MNINYNEINGIVVKSQEELDLIPLDFKGKFILNLEHILILL